MLHIFRSTVYITRELGENDDVFKLAIEIFSIHKTLISDHFDKLAFSLDKKFTEDVIFSHTDTLTGCRLDANNIDFLAYRRLICCYPPRTSRETWVGMIMASFRRRWSFFIICDRHACGRVHSIFFCCPGFGLHTHLLYVAYYNTLKGPSQAPTRPWVRAVLSLLYPSLFQSVWIRVSDDVFLVATWNLLVTFIRYRMPLLGAFSC